MLPMGFCFIAFPLLGRLSRSHGTIAGAGLFITIAVTIVATKQLYDFYDRRYGKVESSKKSWLLWVGMGIWGLAFLRCLILDGLHPQFSLAALWFAGFFWGIYTSSAGRRWHYLVLTACFVFLVPYWGELGQTWQNIVIGAAFIAAGVMDHWLLTRLLPTHPKEQALSAAL